MLRANSEQADGVISRIEVYKLNTEQLVASDTYSSYSASLDLSGLPTGNYVAIVTCTNTVKNWQFAL